MRAAIALVAAVSFGLAVAACPGASASASSPAAAVRAAAVQQKQLSAAQAGCQKVTFAAANPEWAKLSWPARLSAACMKIAANGVIIEHLVGGGWHFVTDGSDIHCPVKGMPVAVARDLGPCS